MVRARSAATVPDLADVAARRAARSRAPASLRGLFSGGTLCDEAMVIAVAALGPVASNIPLRPEWALPDDLDARRATR